MRGNFRPQPWTQAVRVLREMGHDRDARSLAVARENARSESLPRWRLLRRAGRWLLWSTVGYGYRPWRAFWISLFFVAVGWFVFAGAGNFGYMAPRDGNVRVTDAWNKHNELPHTYPPFNALVYAFDAYLPVIEFGQDEAWQPSTKKTVRTIHAMPDTWLVAQLKHAPGLPESFFIQGWHRVTYWVLEALGWVLISLFIAGMSGVMKRE